MNSVVKDFRHRIGMEWGKAHKKLVEDDAKGPPVHGCPIALG